MAIFTEVIVLKDEVSGPAKKAAGSLDSVTKSLGGSSAGLAEFGSLLAAGGAAAGAFAVSVVAIGGALIYSAAKFAIFSSEAKQASLSTWDALGQGVIAGAEVDDMLDGLKGSLGITKDALGGFATSFLKMGINSKEALETLTTAAISAEAVTHGAGEGFVALFQKVDAASQTSAGKIAMPFAKLQTALIGAGLNIGDMAKQMGLTEAAFTDQMKAGTVDAKKFGDAMQDAITNKGAKALERMANSSENLKKALMENIGDMFEDLSDIVAPFMKEVKSLFGVFQKDAPSAKAMTAGIRGVLTEVFGVLTKLVPIAKHFFLDMMILGLRAYIAIKPLSKGVQDFIDKFKASPTAMKALDMLGTGMLVIAGAIGVVVALGLSFIVALTAISTAAIGLGAALVGLVAGGVAYVISGLAGVAQTVAAFVPETIASLAGWVTGATEAASNFVAGLVAGIGAGVGQVTGAISGLASSATGAFKSALGISSPSLVMQGLGENTGEGFAMGLEGTQDDVHGASSGVADAAVKGASAPSEASAGAGGGAAGASIIVNVQIDGAGKSAEGITQELVSQVFQQMALSAGV